MEYRRDYTPGASYFFTVVTNHRNPILIDHVDRLRMAFRRTMDRHPFTIDAIVILPDHLHTIWTLPTGDTDYSSRWQKLKRLFSAGLPATARSISHLKKREKGIWQRRFWEHRIRDHEDLNRYVDYIHFNPVKHGYVSRPFLWPYGSFQNFVDRGIYPADWAADVQKELGFKTGE